METRPILKNKYYLYMTEFFAGMSIMAVELGASRLLAPYFSSSQIVWTIIIGTIMIAMALGNILGGRSADKDPNPDRLYRRILIAAVWIAAIPVLGKYVILLISGVLILTINTNFLILAAFLTCMFLFVYPLLLLGTVTPSLAKYCTDNLETNGKIIGTLGAFNTIGSILGTFLPTFVTIPAVGTAMTFLIFSAVLLLLGSIYFFSAKTQRIQTLVACLLFILCTLFSNSGHFAFWNQNLLYEGESIYNYLQVKNTDDSIILSTNVIFGVQSIMKKDESLTGMYYDYALAAPVMAGVSASQPMDVLVLGMGTGTYARQCKKYFPNATIEGVEIDQKITNLAHTYFSLPNTIPVTTYDGRAYLNASDKKYDVIMVDAYQDITIPFHMSSKEFFTVVNNHLKPNGIMVVNMNMHTTDPDGINSYLTDTILSVFRHVNMIDVEDMTNRELFASQQAEPATVLSQNSTTLADPALRRLMQDIDAHLQACQSQTHHVLTDDKAPVELLGIKMIDGLIQTELIRAKKELQNESISDFLKKEL